MARTNERKPLNLPEEITREYLENLSNGPNGFNELKKMLTNIKSSWKGKSKEEVLSELITYYVLEKKHLKPQV
jgi:transcriptional regulator NrdR family protein